MRSRLGRLSTHWSTIKMAISLLPSQRYFYLYLRAKQIVQLVEYSEQAKPEQQQQLSQGWSLSILPLKIMILTKENVASQAFAEHIIGLSLPSWIEAKIGRLVGFVALHNQTTGTTKLDIPSAHRHEVIGSKQVIIGCGGGFRHECASKYSPVAQWMSEVDLTLHDESQQYGNLDETAAIARLPRSCLVMWLGDHRQTPGGLRKSTAARRFRRKLLKRPLALRGNSNKVQPNTLYQIVGRYLTGTPPPHPVAQLMAPDLLLPQNAQEHLENLAKELLGAYDSWLNGIVPRTALAILWLATHRQDVEPWLPKGW